MKNLSRVVLPLFAWLTLTAPAAASDPLYPQWSAWLPRETLSRETLGFSKLPTWAQLPDGSTVIATLSTAWPIGALVRRYAANGTASLLHIEPMLTNTVLANELALAVDPQRGDTYVQTGHSDGLCRLFHLDANGIRDWAYTSLAPVSDEGRCRGMIVLDDGSVVAVREHSLARIAANGTMQWHVASGEGGVNWTANVVARDANQTIWMGGGIGQSAAVLRFAPDGTRLGIDTLRCGECISSEALSLDPNEDGSMGVGGGSGSEQPGFIAQYAASGSRLSFVNTPIDTRYEQLVHDAAGNLYGLTNTITPEIHRLDRSSGTVLWQQPGEGLSPLPSGVVILDNDLRSPLRARASAWNANGVQQWERTLGEHASADFGRGTYRNDRILLALTLYNGDSATCGRPPHVFALTPSGSVESDRHSCLTPQPTYAESVHVHATHGVLVDLREQLEAFAPDGRKRWTASACDYCYWLWNGGRSWLNAVPAADGGAWAFEIRAIDGIIEERGLQRIDANGVRGGQVPLPPFTDSEESRIVAGAHGAEILLPTSTGILWQQRGDDASVLDTRTFSWWPTSANAMMQSAVRHHPNRLDLVVVRQPSLTSDNVYVNLASLAEDGRERWHFELPSYHSPLAAFETTGEALAVYRVTESGDYVLRAISADGTVAAAVVLNFLPSGVALKHLVSLSAGRFILRSTTDLWLIDRNGSVLAQRHYPAAPAVLQANALGVLVTSERGGTAVAEWLDPTDLHTRSVLGIDTDSRWPMKDSVVWALLDDGTVYGVPERYNAPMWRAHLARFALPGTPAADAIFRHGFE